jgi:hypothetical protein
MHDLVRSFIREDTLIVGEKAFEWPLIAAGLHHVLRKIDQRIAQLIEAHAHGERGWQSNPE